MPDLEASSTERQRGVGAAQQPEQLGEPVVPLDVDVPRARVGHHLHVAVALAAVALCACTLLARRRSRAGRPHRYGLPGDTDLVDGYADDERGDDVRAGAVGVDGADHAGHVLLHVVRGRLGGEDFAGAAVAKGGDGGGCGDGGSSSGDVRGGGSDSGGAPWPTGAIRGVASWPSSASLCAVVARPMARASLGPSTTDTVAATTKQVTNNPSSRRLKRSRSLRTLTVGVAVGVAVGAADWKRLNDPGSICRSPSSSTCQSVRAVYWPFRAA